jgi:uncharacterized protein with FMN-binding domain
MRRSPLVLAATVAGVAAVLNFKPHASATRPASAASAATPRVVTPRTGTSVATGKAIATPYGNAQVRVTVRAGRIVNVEALQLQGSDPKSVQISSSAEPLLRQSALAKQSAAIDAVTGATFTSASYQASLQSALDKLPGQGRGGAGATAP